MAQPTFTPARERDQLSAAPRVEQPEQATKTAPPTRSFSPIAGHEIGELALDRQIEEEIAIESALASWLSGTTALIQNMATSLEEGTQNVFSGKEEPGFGKSLIPVVGSVQSANYHFAHDNPVRGAAYTALAVSDVFLIRSIAVGLARLAERGTVSLAGLGTTLFKELGPGGVGSNTSLLTKSRRFVLQDLKNYQVRSSATFRILREHFKVTTAKGPRAMFEMHHWLIQHKWFAGKEAVRSPALRKLLKSLGNAGWNLVPLPAPINNALGKSATATASLASKVVQTISGELALVTDQLRRDEP